MYILLYTNTCTQDIFNKAILVWKPNVVKFHLGKTWEGWKILWDDKGIYPYKHAWLLSLQP